MDLQNPNYKYTKLKKKEFRLKLIFLAIILIVLALFFAQWLNLKKKESTLNNLKSKIEKIQAENISLEQEISESAGSPDEKVPDRIFSILPK